MKFLGLAVLNVRKIIKARASMVARWWRVRLPTRRHRSDFWSGKIPQAVAQRSLGTANEHALCTTQDPKPTLCNGRSSCREKPGHCSWRAAPALGNHSEAREQQWRRSSSHKHTDQEKIYKSQKQLFPITHMLFSQISRNRWACTRGRDIISYVTVLPNNLCC